MNDNFPNMGSHLILDFKGVKLCNLDNKDVTLRFNLRKWMKF
jgi:hypothetical protein